MSFKWRFVFRRGFKVFEACFLVRGALISRYFRSRWVLSGMGLMFGLVVMIGLILFLQPHTFAGTVLQNPQPAYDYALIGPNGETARLSDLRGKTVLIFFGYTSCPDICPLTMHNLHLVLERLGSQAAQVQVVFITVDPEKDTPQRIQAYLAGIDGRMLGLSGDLGAITQTAAKYGIAFQKQFYNNGSDYSMDHTAAIQLVDSKGLLRVVYPYDTSIEALASDVRYFLSH
jgi:protein SCO1